MPCDSISSVEIGDAGKMDAQHVKRALEAMQLHPRHTRGNIYDHDQGEYNDRTGEARWTAGTDRTQELKRAYAAEIVKSQAARYGWTLKTTTDKYSFTVAKR